MWGGPTGNTVGGDTEGERNVISGNDRQGVVIADDGTDNNVVCGNYIGTNANGSAALGNSWDGVWISNGAQNNTVGGQTSGERNVISGNSQRGVHVSSLDTDGNTVLGNYIGTDASGTLDRGNGQDGVRIEASAKNNTVGPDNLIAYNADCGVSVHGPGTTGNTITQNSIYNNDDVGIELVLGGNGNIPAPAVTAAGERYAMGTAGAGETVEVFTGPDSGGKTYLGTTSADGNGVWLAVGPFTLDTFVTATATDGSGNTSRFSVAAMPGDYGPMFVPLTMKRY
jgi:titin